MLDRTRGWRCYALTLFVLLATGAEAGDASSPPRALAIELDESSLITPADVTYRWTTEGLEIERRVVKRRDRYGRILGHVELDLLDASGRILSHHAAALQRFSPRRKDPDWASFRTLIEAVPPGVARLRVRHRVGSNP